MPDTVGVPVLGQVKKSNLVIGALAGVAVGGYALIKHDKKKAATPATTAGTYGYGYGYGYGTYETTNPYAEMYGYGSLGYGMYGYGGAYVGPVGTGPVPPTGPVGPPATNAEWAQAAISALVNTAGVNAATALGAISVYLLGGHLTAAQANIVAEAIALEGTPPNPPSGTVSPGGGGGQDTGGGVTGTQAAKNPPKGLKLVRNGRNGVQVSWNPVQGATKYNVHTPGRSPTDFTTTNTIANIGNLKPGTKYTIQVWADPTPTGGPHASLTFTTTK
jgi:Fibronectin type III domain